MNQIKYYFFSFLLFLNSCGPIYETKYNFIPPAITSKTQSCLAGCNSDSAQCYQVEKNNYLDCQTQARIEYHNCLRLQEQKEIFCLALKDYQHNADYAKCLKNARGKACSEKYCPKENISKCDAAFRNCYRSCGGIINETVVCIANCEQT
ncbi:MAG: hypothetical protein LBE20_07305 [Deltaproteobacteria bacterium]|jgi:hypothetical protein|nr:hypothetical protein [Deltaproteobacteria bacterium]